MSAFTLDIRGIDQLKERLSKMSKELEDRVDKQLTASALKITAQAKIMAPKDLGGLANAISAKIDQKLNKEVVADTEYAAFVEFGTGPFAAAYVPRLPEEIQKYAMTFFVNGKGHTPAQPFLFPSYEAEKPKLIENIKKEILK